MGKERGESTTLLKRRSSSCGFTPKRIADHEDEIREKGRKKKEGNLVRTLRSRSGARDLHLHFQPLPITTRRGRKRKEKRGGGKGEGKLVPEMFRSAAS